MNWIIVRGSVMKTAVIVAMSVGTGAMNVVVAGRIAAMASVAAVMGGAMAGAGATTEAVALSFKKTAPRRAPEGGRNTTGWMVGIF